MEMGGWWWMDGLMGVMVIDGWMDDADGWMMD